MIEEFRHEAMNQATVVAGFCEIIENFLLKQPGAVSQDFLKVLQNVERLISSFNKTFAVFREESMQEESHGKFQTVEFFEDIHLMLSATSRAHFMVLREMAEGLSVIASSIRGDEIGSSVIASRFMFVQDAASKLNALFIDPANFIRRVSAEERPSY